MAISVLKQNFLTPQGYEMFMFYYMGAYIDFITKQIAMRTRMRRRMCNTAVWRIMFIGPRSRRTFKNLSRPFLMSDVDHSIIGQFARLMVRGSTWTAKRLFKASMINSLTVQNFFGCQTTLSPDVFKLCCEKGTLPVLFTVLFDNRKLCINDILRIDAVSTSVTLIRRIPPYTETFDYIKFYQETLELNFCTPNLRYILMFMKKVDQVYPNLKNLTLVWTLTHFVEPAAIRDNKVDQLIRDVQSGITVDFLFALRMALLMPSSRQVHKRFIIIVDPKAHELNIDASQVFTGVLSCQVQGHPTEDTVVATSGESQIVVSRFDGAENGHNSVGTTIRNDLFDQIGAFTFGPGGNGLYCLSSSCLYSLDTERLQGVSAQIFDVPPTEVLPFGTGESPFSLIVADEDGEVHLLDTRQSPAENVHTLETQSEKNEIKGMTIKDHTLYTITENGVIGAYDLKKRAFSRKLEFDDKFFTSIIMDEDLVLVTTDKNDFQWVDMKEGYVKYNMKRTQFLVEKLQILNDELLLAKPFIGQDLVVIDRESRRVKNLVSDRRDIHDVSITRPGGNLFYALENGIHVDLSMISSSDFVQAIDDKKNQPDNKVDPDFFDGL
ncbi:unnamed protein product [Bursaphelenchus okinawaensis]|uniref:Uncharacterized protein n=1 Tax=Bursaphelenchus okinawaensis TaxID=465554 RepID=A0A811L886_9BILA|nr:unnamed protein product [Bursaphelenchus okinawaensis]CAG9118975.1 unnamed protein product [Bursaphelenchus okinawaensis]